MRTALVLGAGGFIGSHMVKRLRKEGYWVRGVDLKFPEFSKSEANEFVRCDLRHNDFVEAVMRLDYGPLEIPMPYSFYKNAYSKARSFDEVYQFAADMGGAGYVFTGDHDADIMHNSAMINLNVCEWAVKYKVGKVFYSSSACMYPQERQIENYYDIAGRDYRALPESCAYPANPDSEYGWEKLFSERLYLAYARNYGLNVRIARFHNIFGPEGTWKGGKEKAPAAICRKVAEVIPDINKLPQGSIEIWGDGEQTRSFLYIDECIEGVRRLMQSDFTGPVNIGSDELISINDLAQIVCKIADKYLYIQHIDGPQGVRGRNSDNTLIYERLGWKPTAYLADGMKTTYDWIKSQIDAN